jgi:hypothetical protein
MGWDLMINRNGKNIDRQTYGFLMFLSDLGGLIDALKIILGFFVVPFSQLRLKALLTNRLYHVTNLAEDI